MYEAVSMAGLALPKVEVFGVESGLGARNHGYARGPAVLGEGGLQTWLAGRGYAAGWQTVPAVGAALPDTGFVLGTVAGTCARLADGVEKALDRGARFVVLGGDHSCAMGTWSGAARHLRGSGPLGLIWVDAHMDSHVPSTSPSGTYHGMPLACLMGFGEPVLTAIAGGGAAIRPEKVCLVGVRSYERQERELLDRLGVRVIHMGEVESRGMGWALDEALRIAGDGTAAVGLSIDLDAVDPCDAPGVGSPVPGGIKAGDLVDSLARLCRQTRLLGVEIVELDPSLDEGGATERLVRDLLAATHSAGGGP